ncbi:hypothetical protein C0993_012214 [Termitomyces sp. T159_Od127]|nr:hypothetical protein C0993_012214 [Termitomyces sp. T159_Od127]
MSALNARLKQSSSLDLEDALNHGPDFNIFSTPATLLHATALSPNTLSAHIPSQFSQTLLLHTTLPSSSSSVNTLVNSGAANNFIDKSLAMLAAMPQRLLIPIHLTLFDGSSTSVSDITHYVQITLTFTNVLTALINSRATGLFVSDQLNLTHDPLDRLLELQLFDGKPTTTEPITKTHFSSIVLENGLQFLFPSTGACLATIHLHLQSTDDLNEARATSTLTALLNDSGDLPLPQPVLGAPSVFLSNIPCNKYKGPNYPTWHPWITPDTNNADQPLSSLDLKALNIKIIDLAFFARIIQDGTPAFQLHISPALPEEHLGTDTTTLEPKTEEQILHKVVLPEYHEFADVFSEGSTKELLPHWSYDHKINLEDGTTPLFSKIYNMSEVELHTDDA